MEAELIGAIAAVIGIGIGIFSNKLLLVRRDENRFTRIETSLNNLEKDVTTLMKRDNKCAEHAQQIAILQTDYRNLEGNAINVKHDVANLYSITSDIRLDINDINVNIATIKENSLLRTEMMAEINKKLDKALNKDNG